MITSADKDREEPDFSCRAGSDAKCKM
jgi:hypothetical protein